MLSFLFNQLLGSATDQENPELHGNRNSAVNEAVHFREKKQRNLQSFSQTAQVCKSQHNDDAGIPQHVVPSRSQTDCSWCRSLDRDEAPGKGLNHPGLRLQRVPAVSLQDSTGSDRVLGCMRCPLLKLLSYQVKLPRLHNAGETEWEDVYKFFMKKLHLSEWWLETCDYHRKKESSFYFCARGTEVCLPPVNKNIRSCNRIIEKL